MDKQSITIDKGLASSVKKGRFVVTKVDEQELSSASNSVVIPISFFDTPKKSILKSPIKRDHKDRISFDEFKSHYMSFAAPRSLTLYEDDAGNVDTVQGVLMKTVIHRGLAQTGQASHIFLSSFAFKFRHVQPIKAAVSWIVRISPFSFLGKEALLSLMKTGQKANMGTFFGVFLPCCQNIVGIIYFVRFTWIVGTAGILEASAIVFLCTMISFCTAVSMSAIATNGKLTAGGTYFMISRSLGPTFGGSVGFLFFMGTSISVAMYYLGTVEVLLIHVAPNLRYFSAPPHNDFRNRSNDFRLFGTIQLLCMFTFAFIGVKCVSRFACFAIVFLVVAIFSAMIGLSVPPGKNSVIVCAQGNRLISHRIAFVNNTWQCHKNASGPLYRAYCKNMNGTEFCKENFRNHKAELILGVPGLSFARFLANLYPSYSNESVIPGTNEKPEPNVDIQTDIATSFVVLFAIYFPSITGVESGSNYSGDLRDAQISLPRGTMAATLVTSFLYLLSVVLMGSSVDRRLLRDKYGASIASPGDLVLSRLAWPTKWPVLIGTITASIGAGLQALAGGPRLLQAIAEDNIIPHLGVFAKKWRGEPIRGLFVTFIIAEIGILIAVLDVVAPIVTMFFLMCYGFTNFAVTLQSLLDTPHWRPSFKYYHWSLTLFGTTLSLVAMFICDWVNALIAISMAFLLYQYIEYKGAEKEWGDGITGLSMSGALYALNRMKQDFHHTKNWRPQILVLLKMQNMEENATFIKYDYDLVMLADMMKEGKGLTMFATVIKGMLGDNIKQKERIKQTYLTCLERVNVKGFIEVIVTPSIVDGLCCLVQSAGLGALRPNTIIMGWPCEWSDNRNVTSLQNFLETMRNIALSRNAVVILKATDFPSKHNKCLGTIDIWWIVNDGGMLLLLGHLLKRNKTWSRCQLRLFTVALESDNTVQIKEDLQTYLYQLRIDGTVEVVEMAGQDMSAYVYERTLKMEAKTRMMDYAPKKDQRRQSITSTKKVLDKEVQRVLENARSSYDSFKVSGKTLDGSSPIDNVPLLPKQGNIRNMNTAVRLNARMIEKSWNASVIILNLPCVPESPIGQANYMSFLEVLTEGLNPVLLVRGSGSEVITVYN